MENLQRLIAEHPFFQGMEDRHLALLTGCATNVRFTAGEFLIRTGREAHSIYLLRHGRVALEIVAPGHPAVCIQTLSEGEVVGWSWLLPPFLALYDARVLETTVALSLDGKCIREKCESDHDLGYEVFKRFSHLMSQRLQATRLQVLDVFGPAR
jgi:CRP/FNR family transcriptional regulator, cyclic AMP receptor protein